MPGIFIFPCLLFTTLWQNRIVEVFGESNVMYFQLKKLLCSVKSLSIKLTLITGGLNLFLCTCRDAISRIVELLRAERDSTTITIHHSPSIVALIS